MRKIYNLIKHFKLMIVIQDIIKLLKNYALVIVKMIHILVITYVNKKYVKLTDHILMK